MRLLFSFAVVALSACGPKPLIPLADPAEIDDLPGPAIACDEADRSATPPSGAIARYAFCGDAVDKSGHGHHGLLNGTPTFVADRFGVPRSAIVLDGESWVEVPHSNELTFGIDQSYTLSAWVKPSGAQEPFAGVICKGPPMTHDPGYQLYVATDHAKAEISSPSDLLLSGKKRLDDGQWHHIALVVQARLTASLFVDGVREAEIVDGLMAPDASNKAPLFIGHERNSVQFYAGALDDIIIYDRALDNAEILAL